MPRQTKAERHATVHERARREFDTTQEAQFEVRKECLQDRRFYSITGAMWEGPLGDQFENKPKFEVNKAHLSVIRIINEYRNNRITANFEKKPGADDDLAELCDGLYRADEQDSVAQEAYDNAFEEAVGGGFGAWRYRAEYEDEEDDEDERQRICIEPIFDADTSVYFDLNAKRQDKSDAKRCWVLTSMTRDAFEEEYPDDDPSTWPKTADDVRFDWYTADVVYVAEYYEVEEVRKTVHVWESILDDKKDRRYSDDDLEEDDGALRRELEATGWKEVRTKRVKKCKVHKYIMSGSMILEDLGYIAGPNIPIVPVYGKRWFIDNVERCMGHVRLSKDPLRLKNMQVSKLGEISALSSVEKPIFFPEQIAGHTDLWAEDNLVDNPYLLINPVADQNGQETLAGPVSYTKPPQVPPALAALLQLTEDDVQDLLGNQQQGEQLEGNISTETAHLIQNRLDMQTFIYLSNFAKAVKRGGEIWLGMAKDLMVEEDRVMKTVGSQDEVNEVMMMQRTIDDKGDVTYANDLSRAKLDVTVDVGPASSTKRAATIRSLTNVMQITDDPETKQVLSAMIMMNMEGEGVNEVRDFFRKKLIKMGVVKPTQEEADDLAAELQNQQPSAQDQYLLSSAKAEEQRGEKAASDTILNQAKADSERVDALMKILEIDEKQARLAMEVIEKLGPRAVPPEQTTQIATPDQLAPAQNTPTETVQ